jgi:hypothetical protein
MTPSVSPAAPAQALPRRLPRISRSADSVAVGERPILNLAAEASFYAPYNHCTVGYLNRADVKVTYVKFADIGLRGNGHMMMMEKNSDAIAQVIVDWLDKNVPAPPAPR